MDLSQVQFLVMGVIFIATTIVGLTPVLLKGNLPNKLVPSPQAVSRLLSAASCFGAGVFMFVCFMGLLPEADEKFHHFLQELAHTDEKWHKFAEFPWGFFVVTMGFLMIFTIDKVVHAMDEAHHSHADKNENSQDQSELISFDSGKSNDSEVGKMIGNEEPHECEPCDSEHGSHTHGIPSSLFFLFALGIHSIFEGMAVGLQTHTEKVTELALAILIHEMVMAFTFGMEVSKSNTLHRWGKIMYVLTFGLTIPFGVAIGYGLQNAPSEHRQIISAIFEAFATGIFIHVIFIEILAHEFPGHQHHHTHHHHVKRDGTLTVCEPDTPPRQQASVILEKVGFICLGLLTLILLSVFNSHSHHH